MHFLFNYRTFIISSKVKFTVQYHKNMCSNRFLNVKHPNFWQRTAVHTSLESIGNKSLVGHIWLKIFRFLLTIHEQDKVTHETTSLSILEVC